jgi:chromate transporter
MTAVPLYLVLLRAVVLSFSGFASVPLVRAALVVEQAVLTDTQLNDAIAISQASPGPLGLYVVIVGYFAGGIGGAIAGGLALATPALLAIPIAAAVQRGRADHIRGASAGIVIASCMLMLVAGVRLAPEAAPTLPYTLIAVAGFAVLAQTRVQPVWVILGAAALGAAF